MQNPGSAQATVPANFPATQQRRGRAGGSPCRSATLVPAGGRKYAEHFSESRNHITKTFTLDGPRSRTPSKSSSLIRLSPFYLRSLLPLFFWHLFVLLPALLALALCLFPRAHRFEEGSSRWDSKQSRRSKPLRVSLDVSQGPLRHAQA